MIRGTEVSFRAGPSPLGRPAVSGLRLVGALLALALPLACGTPAPPILTSAAIPMCEFEIRPEATGVTLENSPSRWDLIDLAGVVERCEVFVAEPEPLLPGADVVWVRNPLNDMKTLDLVWLETLCSGDGKMTVQAVNGDLGIVVSSTISDCPAVGATYRATEPLSRCVEIPSGSLIDQAA